MNDRHSIYSRLVFVQPFVFLTYKKLRKNVRPVVFLKMTLLTTSLLFLQNK